MTNGETTGQLVCMFSRSLGSEACIPKAGAAREPKGPRRGGEAPEREGRDRDQGGRQQKKYMGMEPKPDTTVQSHDRGFQSVWAK